MTLPRTSVRAPLGGLPAYCVQSETSASVSSADNPLPEARPPTTLEVIIGPSPFAVLLPGSAIARGSATRRGSTMRAGSATPAASRNARVVSTVVRGIRLRP